MKRKLNTPTEWSRVQGLMLAGAGDFAKCNEHEENYNQNQGKGNLSLSDILSQIYHSSSSSFSALTASSQHTIAKSIFTVNTNKFPIDPGIPASDMTTKLEQTVENTLNWAREISNENLINIQSNIPHDGLQWKELSHAKS